VSSTSSSNAANSTESAQSARATPTYRLSRIAFTCYVLLIFTATHWPQLKLPGPGRSDLWIHMSVFSLWTALLAMTAWLGPRWSRANITSCAVATLAYAAFDESTQYFSPGRTVALDDFGANAAGVLLGSFALLAIAALKAKASALKSSPSARKASPTMP